jgi:hypothetical protein
LYQKIDISSFLARLQRKNFQEWLEDTAPITQKILTNQAPKAQSQRESSLVNRLGGVIVLQKDAQLAIRAKFVNEICEKPHSFLGAAFFFSSIFSL